jgi:hypothetical protein
MVPFVARTFLSGSRVTGVTGAIERSAAAKVGFYSVFNLLYFFVVTNTARSRRVFLAFIEAKKI